MIDVFFRTAPKTELRYLLAFAALERWNVEQNNVKLRSIVMSGTRALRCEVALAEDGFAWTSRKYADENATTDPYIFIDDDHLLLGADWVKRALAEWEENPGYTLLSATSCVATEIPYSGALWQTGLYTEAACAGAPIIHKKGVIPYQQFMGQKASQQDIVVADWLRAHGHKFAMMKSVHYLHLGYGLSQVEPLLWMRY